MHLSGVHMGLLWPAGVDKGAQSCWSSSACAGGGLLSIGQTLLAHAERPVGQGGNISTPVALEQS